MRRWLTPSVVVPCAIIAAVAAMVVSANLREGRPHGRPSPVPPSIGSVGAPPTSSDGLARRIAEMERRLGADPDDLHAAVSLAEALVRQSRVTGDGGVVARAASVLERATQADPLHYGVRHMLATVRLSQHRFRDALALAAECQAQRPDDASVDGMIGDAHLELGDYEAAFAAFERMVQRRPNAASYARVAYARELQGDLQGALHSMTLAADAAGGGDLEGQAWYRSQVGELQLALGRPAEAMQQFAQASQAFPGHPFAVTGYARALEAMGRRGDALALLQDLASRAPSADVYERIGALLSSLGQADAAAKAYAHAEAAWRSDTPEPRQLARFLADRGTRLDEAVRIAEDASRDRQDIFTQDALAWAYFKSGRLTEARHWSTLAQRTGSKDPQIRAHAVAIASAAGSAG